jgi:NodT family efflux transporter outer membrane factor (OMF) lipoprotein
MHLGTDADGLQTDVTQRLETAPVSRDWWTRFQDPQLSHWIELGLSNHPSLAQAQARAQGAQALAQLRRAAKGPSVGLGADVDREHISANGFFPPPLAGATDSIYDAGVSARWNLDLFGGLEQAAQAADVDARRERLVTDELRIRLAGAIAHAYIDLARAQALRAKLVETATARGTLKELVAQRVRAGFDTQIDKRGAELPLPEIQSQIARADESIALAKHALAMWAGQAPDAAADVVAKLPSGQMLAPPAVLPIDLLSRRADVLEARWRVEARLHEVAAARAAFYPDVNLTALIGLDSLGANVLLRGASRTWQVEPAIHLPLFDGGALRANLNAASADTDEAIAAYNAAVLKAANDVADALSSLHHLERLAASQSEAERLARSTQQLAQTRLDAGLANRLAVQSASQGVLAQERERIDIDARRAALSIDLALALGGGFRDAPVDVTAAASTQPQPR